MRRFIYEYNGQRNVYDVEEDLSGRREAPAIGSTMSRNGREWKVIHVVAPVNPSGGIPVVRVFLTDITRFKGRTLGVRHLPK
jgi:hypothetical protein